jgi:hypothetical protein
VAYHTALVLAAGRPFPVQIGERTVVARPVSVPVALDVQAALASGDVLRMEAAYRQLLRAAFPRPRLGWRDPVRLVAALPVAIQRGLFQRLLRVPHDAPVVASSDDPLAATRAWQKAAVRGDGTQASRGPRPTLLLAAQACRATYGEAWYYAPHRWATTDGYVPHDICWLEFAGLSALEARAQLQQINAHVVAHSGKDARRSVDALIRDAYPIDPLTTPPTRGGLVH